MTISALPPALEQAVRLFSKNQFRDAITLLRQRCDDPQEQDPRHWYTLLDLYRIHGMRAEFDRLSLDFTLRFERSAPAWPVEASVRQSTMTYQPGQRTYTLVLPMQTHTRLLATQIAQINRQLTLHSRLKIDFNRIVQIDRPAIECLFEAWENWSRQGLEISVSGGPIAINRLKQMLRSKSPNDAELFWQLLFRLYQEADLPAEFEKAALEYAQTFERSPPSWSFPQESDAQVGLLAAAIPTPVLRVIPSVQARKQNKGWDKSREAANGTWRRIEVKKAPVLPPPTRGYPLPAHWNGEAALALLRAYVENQAETEIEIDCAALQHLDAAHAAALASALSVWQAQGKRMQLRQLSILIALLLSLHGYAPVADGRPDAPQDETPALSPLIPHSAG